MSPRPRGVAIPTAMFIVLLLFGLVTAIQLTTTENLRITRYGHAKVRAEVRARSASQKLLYCLANPTSSLAQNDLRLPGGNAPIGDLLAALKAATPSTGVRVKLDSGETFDPAATLATGWIEHSTDPATPDLEILVTQATVNEQTQRTHVAVGEQPLVDGVVYARIGEGVEDRGTTYFYRKTSDGVWKPVPPVPLELYYRNDPAANSVPQLLRAGASPYPTGPEADPAASPSHNHCPTRFARTVWFPTADDQGHLYATVHRSGTKQYDTVMRVDITQPSPRWSPLPPLPRQVYDNSGTLHDVGAVPRIRELASNGGNLLYARVNRDGPDTIWQYNLNPAASPGASPLPPTVTALPPVPKYVYRGDGVPLPRTGFVQALTDLSADSQGNLYCRWPRDGVDTLYRWEIATGAWRPLPPPPRKVYRYRAARGDQPAYYELVPLHKAAHPNEPLVAFNLRFLAADRSMKNPHFSRLVAVFNREGVDTIYRLDVPTDLPPVSASPPPPPNPSATPAPDVYTWQVLPPAPAIFYREVPPGAQPSPYGDPTRAAGSESKACLDGSGVLFIRWNRGGVDSLFNYQVGAGTTLGIYPAPDDVQINNGAFQLLNVPSAKSYRKNETLSDPPLYDTSRTAGLPLNILDFCGGGVPGPPGAKVVQQGDYY